MRRLKIAVCLIFVASCAIFAGYTVKSKMLEDHTPPVITCKDKTVILSVQTDQKKQKKALLKGVKAEDGIRDNSGSRGLGDVYKRQFPACARSWRIVKKLCLGVDVAETEDEKFGVVDSV